MTVFLYVLAGVFLWISVSMLIGALAELRSNYGEAEDA